MDAPLPLERELKILFPGKPPLFIIDAGACEGEDSIRYSRLFPNAMIYAFEPLPGNIDRARANLSGRNIQNVKLIGKALADKNGSARFFVSSGQPADTSEYDWDFGNKSSSLLSPAKHLEISEFVKFDTTITVETITLDEFCGQHKISIIDFIHIDVQGAEMMVLQGAVKNLRFIKAVWLETSTLELYQDQPLADEIEGFMHDNGFVMVRDCLYGVSGERLYISKTFFPKYRRLFPAWTRRRSLLRKVLRKAGL